MHQVKVDLHSRYIPQSKEMAPMRYMSLQLWRQLNQMSYHQGMGEFLFHGESHIQGIIYSKMGFISFKINVNNGFLCSWQISSWTSSAVSIILLQLQYWEMFAIIAIAIFYEVQPIFSPNLPLLSAFHSFWWHTFTVIGTFAF